MGDLNFFGDELDIDLDEVEEVEIRVVGGEVSVTAGDRAHLEAEVSRGPDFSASLDHGLLIVAHEPQRRLKGLVTVDARITVALTVPPDVPVRIRVVTAEVVVAGMHAGMSVATVSGDVTGAGLRGTITVRTVSGEVDLRDVSGSVSVNTVSGEIGASALRVENLSVRTVSGDLFADVEDHTSVSAHTVSGDVTLRVDRADASVDVNSMSGRIDCGLDLEEMSAPKRRLFGRTGTGMRSISVRTMSGDVALVPREPAPV